MGTGGATRRAYAVDCDAAAAAAAVCAVAWRACWNARTVAAAALADADADADADDGDEADEALPVADEVEECCGMALRLIDAVSGRVCSNGGAFTADSGVGKKPSLGM